MVEKAIEYHFKFLELKKYSSVVGFLIFPDSATTKTIIKYIKTIDISIIIFYVMDNYEIISKGLVDFQFPLVKSGKNWGAPFSLIDLALKGVTELQKQPS